MITRRQFLFSLAAAGTAGVSVPAYARYVEPRWLERTERLVRLPACRLERPLRLLHLSDFHLSRHVPLSFIRRAIDLGLSADPDVICVTGDFVTGRIRAYDIYGKELARLSAAAPTLACLGNHDGGAWVRRYGGYASTTEVCAMLKASGIDCLCNEARDMTVHGQSLRFVGLGDLWAEELAPQAAFAPAGYDDGRGPVIVLSHNPDSKELLQPFGWDLMLCGHTHGGQLSLPLLGTPFAPVDDHRFVEGLHEWSGRQIYITRGVGNVQGVRFNCRPEVSVLTLVER